MKPQRHADPDGVLLCLDAGQDLEAVRDIHKPHGKRPEGFGHLVVAGRKVPHRVVRSMSSRSPQSNPSRNDRRGAESVISALPADPTPRLVKKTNLLSFLARRSRGVKSTLNSRTMRALRISTSGSIGV